MSYNGDDEDAKEECRGAEEECGGASSGSDAEQEAISSTPQGDCAEGGADAMGGQAGGFVYFIETEDGQFVKIGYSTRPYRRLSQLGTLRPGNHALRLIGWMPGTIQTERWLQGKFTADRDNGEWFRDSVGLRLFIGVLGLIQPKPEPAPAPRLLLMPPKPTEQKLSPTQSAQGPASAQECKPGLLVTCLRCGHRWLRRSLTRPKQCPGCKQIRWDEAPRPVGRPESGKKKAAK